MNLKIKNVVTALLVFFAFSITAFAQSNCRDLRGCERKLCELKTKLEYAKKYGRTRQIQGLERAIKATESNCNSKNYSRDIDKKIVDKEMKVLERADDLKESIRKNEKPEKIEKRKRKLAEAERELAEAKRKKLNQ